LGLIFFRDDPEKFEVDLLNVARTTLSSKLLTQHKDFFAKMAVKAILRLKGSGNLEAIQVTWFYECRAVNVALISSVS